MASPRTHRASEGSRDLPPWKGGRTATSTSQRTDACGAFFAAHTMAVDRLGRMGSCEPAAALGAQPSDGGHASWTLLSASEAASPRLAEQWRRAPSDAAKGTDRLPARRGDRTDTDGRPDGAARAHPFDEGRELQGQGDPGAEEETGRGRVGERAHAACPARELRKPRSRWARAIRKPWASWARTLRKRTADRDNGHSGWRLHHGRRSAASKVQGTAAERVRTTAAPAPARAAPTRAESQPRPASDVVIEIVAGDAGGAKEKPVSTAWTCTSCLAEHRDDWKTLCRICEKPKAGPESAPSPAAVVSSRAELEGKQKELRLLKESMAANKLPVQEIDARLAEIARSLSGAAAPPPLAQTLSSTSTSALHTKWPQRHIGTPWRRSASLSAAGSKQRKRMRWRASSP